MLVIVQYQRKSGKLIGIDRYTDDEQDASLQRLEELDMNNRDPDVEIVQLGSASEAMMAKTHSKYFSDYAMSDLRAAAATNQPAE